MQKQKVHFVAAALVLANIASFEQLKKDDKGYTVHSGTTSGGQEVHSIKSKIDAKAGILTLNIGGKDVSMKTTDAEVCFAQLLPQLAAANQGMATKS